MRKLESILFVLLACYERACGIVILPGSSPRIFDTQETIAVYNFTEAQAICASCQGKLPGEDATRMNLASVFETAEGRVAVSAGR